MRASLSGILASIPPPAPPRPGDDFKYNVRPIPEAAAHFFGRDSNGLPCLLLAASDTSVKAPVRLAGIEVQFARPCRLAVSDGPEATENLTTVLCTSQDPVVQDYFAQVCETIVHIVGFQPTLQQVADAVRRLVDLFQHLARPSLRSTIGMFGELYTIHASTSPTTAVAAWRSTIDERFDFALGARRLEVKSSSTRQRAHSFSLEQCTPPPATLGILISLFVEASGGGLSLLELVERIETQLDGNVDLILKVQEVVAEGLGSTAATALSMRFDEDLARSSLRVYRLDTIPAIRNGVPGEVSQVGFRSDISRTPVADVAALIAQHNRVRALLPNKA